MRVLDRHRLYCLVTLGHGAGCGSSRRKSPVPMFAGALKRSLPNHSWMQARRPGIRNHRD